MSNKADWLKYDADRRRYENKYFHSTQTALNKITKPVYELLKMGVTPNPDNNDLYDMTHYIENLDRMWINTSWIVYENEIKDLTGTKSMFDTIKSAYLDKVLDYINKHSSTKITGVGNYAKELSRRVLKQIALEGLSVDNAASRYQTLMNVYNRARAVTIVRTEIGESYNKSRSDAANTAAKETGLLLEKRWIRAYDDKTRDDHKLDSSKYIPSDQPFNVGGIEMMRPSDPAGGAKNVINCRCTVGYRRVKQNRVE